jgi:hypothetical protein
MQVPSGFKRLSPGMYRAPTGELMQRGAGGAMTVSPRSGVKPQASFQAGSAVRPQPLPPAPTGFKPLCLLWEVLQGINNLLSNISSLLLLLNSICLKTLRTRGGRRNSRKDFSSQWLNLQGQGYGQQAMQGVAQGQPLAQDRSGLYGSASENWWLLRGMLNVRPTTWIRPRLRAGR